MRRDVEINLKNEAEQEIHMLLERKHHPEVREDIDLVWVFSGPGTYYEPFKGSDPEWGRYMDRYRILYGAAIMREVTAKRLKKPVQNVTKDDICRDGPLLFYNGTPLENNAFRKALDSSASKIPHYRVYLVDTVVDPFDNREEPISNTRDQVESFPPELGKGNRRVALVSHAMHIPRILRYIEKYQVFTRSTSIEIFSLKPPKSGRDLYSKHELDRVIRYFENGDLSYEPFVRVTE